MEYFPDAMTISIHNVVYEHGERATRAIWAIHAAYVLHDDINERNILLLPDGRIVWIDFNSARCGSYPELTRFDLFSEFHEVWDLFYMQLLPNKRIGWSGRLEAPVRPRKDRMANKAVQAAL